MKTREQLVITSTIETAGCVTYSRCASETDLVKLTAAWEAQGLDVKALPSPPKDEVALGRAVNAQAEKRKLVRPLARRGAWAIVQETVVEGQPPTYSTRMTVRSENGIPISAAVDASGDEYITMRAAISAAFESYRLMLAHSDVSAWLIDMAYKLGAVSLRESGGVYFIPRTNTSIWMKVAAALDAVGSSVFTIPAMKTAEAVAAITDAITAEAAALSKSIEDEMEKTGEDALGSRALKTRVNTLEEMIAKVSTYEELIGRQLEIRERVQRLSANVSAAALTAMNESEAA
jgi:hypothetical protein